MQNTTAGQVDVTLNVLAQLTDARTLNPVSLLRTTCAVSALLSSPAHVGAAAAATTRTLLSHLLAALTARYGEGRRAKLTFAVGLWAHPLAEVREDRRAHPADSSRPNVADA